MEESDSKKALRSRLHEIENEIEDLKKTHGQLSKRWEKEKGFIGKIRDSKAQIEELKTQAMNFEREGNLAKVAEIRYGKLLELEKAIREAGEALAEIQKDGKLLKEEVDAEDIADIVGKWTGIPVNKMLEGERSKLIKMEERIHKRVIGQEEAVRAVANAIRRSRAGLQDINRPIGSFIFMGTTGVGKTETARALAEFLFDDENSIVRIDMSEYMEKFSVSRLIGAPPGYVGYEEGGQLTEAVRRKPYSVVLLDEIEKAHPEVFNVLLQMLDDGRLTDSKGRLVNFKNTIIIMTSNLGTEIIQERLGSETDDHKKSIIMSGVKQQVLELLRKRMRPEFLNRIDEIVIFKPLSQKDILQVAGLQIEILREKLNAQNIDIEFTQEAMEWLSELGFDSQSGARPLKRALQNYISNPLAIKLLSGEFSAGDKIIVELGGKEGFAFRKEGGGLIVPL